jgi:RNA polymerase sigma-70 factor (ECF subfamily)
MKRGEDAFWTGFSPDAPGPTSLTLVERAQRGDEESRERLCRLYGRLVWTRYLGRVPVQDRLDVWQDVFRTVFQELASFHKGRFDGPAFRAWLYRIARHKVGDYLRRDKRRGVTVSPFDLDAMLPHDGNGQSGPDSLDPRDEAAEKAVVVHMAFEEVSKEFEDRTMEAARRVLIDAQPVGSVVAALGMTANAVYVARSKVLARLRAVLNEFQEPVELATAGQGPIGAEP